ncbi:MAG: helix-turn-helix domain-containing protein [Desulfovibrio sp.]|jgi:DNA-binding XRE family transcriptional regulator|nr:helix-turn-helix domain-containing protein [Desulfovibrio sp.]
MLAEMKLASDNDGRGVIQLAVPPDSTMQIAEVIRGVLTLAGHKVRRVDDEGEEWVTAEEVFPDGSPAMALRGLRGREDLTQVEFAERIGVSQNAISEMESGKRPISTKMAKRIGEVFNISYKVLL